MAAGYAWYGGHFTSGSPTGRSLDNRIIALASGSFTVDDDGVNAHPNQNTIVYNYLAIG